MNELIKLHFFSRGMIEAVGSLFLLWLSALTTTVSLKEDYSDFVIEQVMSCCFCTMIFGFRQAFERRTILFGTNGDRSASASKKKTAAWEEIAKNFKNEFGSVFFYFPANQLSFSVTKDANAISEHIKYKRKAIKTKETLIKK